MKIIYNKNPLKTVVELDEHEQKEFWYKIKIEEMEELLFEAHFYSEDKYLDMERVKEAVDPKYYMTEKNEKSELEKRCDELLEHYLMELRGWHVGDCTCVACSCSKCHAESLLGIDTIKGLGKHSAYKIDAAFGKNNEKTIDEAIDSLANYKPIIADPKVWEKVGGYERYVPRWTAEAKAAYDWLVEYKNTHFNNGEQNGNHD